MTAECIEQIAVGRSLQQRTLVMLTVQFDQIPADIAHQRNRDRLVVDESLGAAVG